VRANPGKLNFGSAGVGTTQQFAGDLMKQTAELPPADTLSHFESIGRDELVDGATSSLSQDRGA
jgi:Tripartite tricarboxylate transporter family receptor